MSYLCTTPQGRDAYLKEQAMNNKAIGNRVLKYLNAESTKKSNHSSLAVLKQISPFAVPTETKGVTSQGCDD